MILSIAIVVLSVFSTVTVKLGTDHIYTCSDQFKTEIEVTKCISDVEKAHWENLGQ